MLSATYEQQSGATNYIQIKPLKDDRDQEIVALDRVAERIASLLDA